VPRCGDYGGRSRSGERCRRPVPGKVRCPAHRDRPHLKVTPRRKPFDVSEFAQESRLLWASLLEVVPESERPELYVALLAFDGALTAERSVDVTRHTRAWLEWRKALKVGERLRPPTDGLGEILRLVRAPE